MTPRGSVRMILFTAAGMLMLSLFVLNTDATAEPCRMIGCGNQVFYVFLPDAMLTSNADATIPTSGKLCKADDTQTFARKGLPAVNEVATLKANGRWVYTEQQIEEEADLFQPSGSGQSAVADCASSWEAPDGGGSLDAGMKLQVLGYRTFIGHRKTELRETRALSQPTSYPEQLLFAMVLVAD